METADYHLTFIAGEGQKGQRLLLSKETPGEIKIQTPCWIQIRESNKYLRADFGLCVSG